MLNLKFNKNQLFAEIPVEISNKKYNLELYMTKLNSTIPVFFMARSTEKIAFRISLIHAQCFTVNSHSYFLAEELKALDMFMRHTHSDDYPNETNWDHCISEWERINSDIAARFSQYKAIRQPNYIGMKYPVISELYDDLFILKPNLTKFQMRKYKDISIAINIDERKAKPYFKIYIGNEKNILDKDYCVRISFSTPEIIHSPNGVIPEIAYISGDIKRKAFEYMGEQNTTYRAYSNWDVAKYKWNVFCDIPLLSIDKYYTGYYDYEYKKNPKFIPSSKYPRHIILN